MSDQTPPRPFQVTDPVMVDEIPGNIWWIDPVAEGKDFAVAYIHYDALDERGNDGTAVLLTPDLTALRFQNRQFGLIDDDALPTLTDEETTVAAEVLTDEPFDVASFVGAATGAPATEVLADAEATQDHGPLAAHLSERTLDKVLSRPAYVPPSPTKDAIVEAALRWHAIRNANAEDVTPLALFDADDALNMAVKAHHAAVTS